MRWWSVFHQDANETQILTCVRRLEPRSWCLTCSGAVTTRAWIWLAAWVRALTPERRATRSILDSFHRSIPSFGSGGGRSAKSSSGSGFGVYGVGLAPKAAQLAVRTVHLYHLDTCCGQMTGQAGAVTAGAFHTDLNHLAPGAKPSPQLHISWGVGPELLRPQQATGSIHHRPNMGIPMGATPPYTSTSSRSDMLSVPPFFCVG